MASQTDHLWALGCAQVPEALPLYALGNLHHIQASWTGVREHLHGSRLKNEAVLVHEAEALKWTRVNAGSPHWPLARRDSDCTGLQGIL